MTGHVVRHPFANHAARAEDMRAQPGVWVQVGVYNSRQSATAIVRNIRSAMIRAYSPAGSYDGGVRMVEDGYAVDGRYVGGSK